jgi:hypothetical protein
MNNRLIGMSMHVGETYANHCNNADNFLFRKLFILFNFIIENVLKAFFVRFLHDNTRLIILVLNKINHFSQKRMVKRFERHQLSFNQGVNAFLINDFCSISSAFFFKLCISDYSYPAFIKYFAKLIRS